MTRKECIDGLQRIIDEDRNKILVRVHVGYLIHAVKYLKDQPDIVCCKDCKWYDERISMCDNCGLPRERTFFCADGKRRGE